MATARQFVSIAIAENGYKESGDNLTKYGEWFGGDGDPWCAMFVSWCAAKAGIPEDIIPRTNSAGEFVYQAKYNGIGTYHAKGSGYSPQIGDLFIVGYQSGTSAQHVGIVAEDAANGTFLSIEGNASDRVLQQTRNVSENDYVTPQFDNKAGQTVQYTNFPKYTLSESAIRDIATMITGEQGGEDELACRQEASQLANLNEVYYGKGATETDILNSLHRGWYEKLSWSRGCTQTAIDAVRFVLIDAVRFVLIDGKRVLPRYVTEHDEFPNHIKNAKERNEYIKHQTQVSNYAGADYIFYCFFGTDQDKDIAGYLKSSYEKYKNDVPWSDTAEGITEEGETKITSSRVVSETGGRGEARPNPLEGQNTLGGACELYIINHDGKIMFPAVLGEITLEICRKGVPGKLLFSVLKSDELDFND